MYNASQYKISIAANVQAKACKLLHDSFQTSFAVSLNFPAPSARFGDRPTSDQILCSARFRIIRFSKFILLSTWS